MTNFPLVLHNVIIIIFSILNIYKHITFSILNIYKYITYSILNIYKYITCSILIYKYIFI